MQALADVKGQLAAYSFPQHLAGYTYTGPASFPTPLEYAGADRIDVAAYQRGDETLFVAAIRYELDRPGHKFVSSTNRAYSFDWNRVGGGIVKRGAAEMRYDDLRPKIRLDSAETANTTALREVAGHWRVYSWYAVAGETTTSDLKAKLFAVYDWLTPRAEKAPPTVYLVATRQPASGTSAEAPPFGALALTDIASN